MSGILRLKTPPMPIISAVKPAGEFKIFVSWNDGIRAKKEDVVDLSPLINSFRMFKSLRHDQELFGSIRVSDEGHAVAWGDGAVDMSATSIERLAEETMTSDDFRDFLRKHNLTHAEAAAVLGRSRRQIENYLSDGNIPRVVALACIGFSSRRTPQPKIDSDIKSMTSTADARPPIRPLTAKDQSNVSNDAFRVTSSGL